MSMRHTTKARRALTAVAITTGLVLSVASCGGDSGSDKPKPDASQAQTPAKNTGEKPKESSPQAPPAADTVLAEVKGGTGVTLVVNSAKRDSGGFVTVTGKVKNSTSGFWNPSTWRGNEQELDKNAASMAGASLVDRAGKKKYLILRDTDGRCLCTVFGGGFQPNEEKIFFAQFPAPPAASAKVDFQIADMPPAAIEISEG